jgi:hypothetical protein
MPNLQTHPQTTTTTDGAPFTVHRTRRCHPTLQRAAEFNHPGGYGTSIALVYQYADQHGQWHGVIIRLRNSSRDHTITDARNAAAAIQAAAQLAERWQQDTGQPAVLDGCQ